MAEVSDNDLSDEFALEDTFPSAPELFDPHTAPSAADDNVLIALDTNALLLPYEIKAGNLAALKIVYEQLSQKKRLWVPDRVVREFVRNRDVKLADLIKALEDRKSRELPAADMPPIFESIAAFNDATKSLGDLAEARKKYAHAIDALISEMKKWRGDDPIIKMYSETLKPNIAILPLGTDARKELLKQWRWRLKNRIAPGYKDAAKSDTGIGDFLVWKTLINLGEKHKKDLAFVTGEQKSDWFARSSGEGVYPKPELLDEYRRASAGKRLRLMSLHELLAELKVAGPVVAEVKIAEDAANTAIMTAASTFILPSMHVKVRGGSIGGIVRGRQAFDYSTNDGKITVGSGVFSFDLRFSKASNTSIHIYKDGTNLTHIAGIKSDFKGDIIRLEDFDTSSRVYTIQLGERFLARNADGRLLLGKISGIKDDTRGADRDEVVFDYVINVEASSEVPGI